MQTVEFKSLEAMHLCVLNPLLVRMVMCSSVHAYVHVHRHMRGINIGGLTERKAFKHFGEELIIICQQESGLKYWGGSASSRNILGGTPAPPAPPLPTPMM